ncbi:hypothetical protein O4H53_03525 [Sulfitobacter sp. G21635-S1]|jgi:hypothetical protein|uniref:hypothetical protein n=1 Tax=Sulfitobacter sp. G21635-S1 TaxID=3014043 RepID=UPI0022B07EDC|nr:hypothetical protein [Sulfitobacter sp. G21635-S1]MCZ4254597.1 hypothetical protein [Sulfitobacter sp. G21635-S1]
MPFTKYLRATAIAAATLPALAQAEVLSEDNPTIRSFLCVGFNCADQDIAGIDDFRVKDNTIRIHFDDVSSSSSPDNDWRIMINDSASGSDEYFAIQDATRGPQIFRLSAGAPENALFMAPTGRIGLKTSMPLRELHMVDANTVTLRMDQRGGSAPVQVWDINANHNAFYVTDISNSTTPYRIEPGAPSDSFSIESNGFIGLGTNAPEELLHIRTTADNTDAFALFDAAGSGSDSAFRLRQNGVTPTTWEFRNQQDSGRLNVGIAGGNTPLKIDNTANNNLLRLGRNGRPDEVVVTGKLVVNNTEMNVPDYVFEPGYKLKTLAEVDQFIAENGHLPGVPSAADVAATGLDMTRMQLAQLEKIEELTLHSISQDKQLSAQQEEIAQLRAMVETLVEAR